MEVIMDAEKKALYEARARVLKALAHPTRLFIADELSRGERCVCELTAMIGADMSTVSRHLTMMKNAGIVDSEKRGAQIWYTLRVPCVLNFFNCVESIIKANVNRQIELVK